MVILMPLPKLRVLPLRTNCKKDICVDIGKNTLNQKSTLRNARLFLSRWLLIRHEFPPGNEPTVYTADICAEVGHEHCKRIDTTIAGHEGSPVFCICLCHRAIKGEQN